MIPGYNDSPGDAAGFTSLLRDAGADSVQLLPFHQFGKNKYALLRMNYKLAEKKVLHPEDLENFAALFEQQDIRALFYHYCTVMIYPSFRGGGVGLGPLA